MACHDDFAGTSSFSHAFSCNNSYNSKTKGIWIVDTRASTHMCCDMKLMFNIKPVQNMIPVTLPDGSIKIVKLVGDIRLSEILCLMKLFIYLLSNITCCLSVDLLKQPS